jgi:hypothetical protein
MKNIVVVTENGVVVDLPRDGGRRRIGQIRHVRKDPLVAVRGPKIVCGMS